MTFQAEFPDFPAADMPAIPAGFDDVSWHNDSCPSFLNEAAGLIIFVDFADPEKREYPEMKRFSLRKWDGGTDAGADDTETDDWSEIQAAIAAKQKA